MTTGVPLRIVFDNNQDLNLSIKVAISSICGDNKGIYEFLGFKQSFQPKSFICRKCEAKGSKNELMNLKENIDFVTSNAMTLIADYRLKKSSVFSCLPGISVYELAAFDVMHDLDEGIMEKIIILIIQILEINCDTLSAWCRKKNIDIKIVGTPKTKIIKIKGTANMKFRFFKSFSRLVKKNR